ncbi:MAG: His/Gly/Thr/Pro-type tRNA ligase C-terminal domain-containing protein, partial [Fervidicoccaceae archaeon]
RYDNLISMFKGEPLPATGGSLGIERIIDVMLERKLINLREAINGAFIVVLDESVYREAWNYAMELRKRGIIVEMDLLRRTPEKQKKRMNAMNYKYAIYFGKKEAESRVVTIVDRESGSRAELGIGESIKMMELKLKNEEAE